MMKIKKNVVIVGLGYIGLPTAAILANAGYSVVGVDINKDVVRSVNEGKIHIVEPDLDRLVSKAVESGALIASAMPADADIFVIAVPTPFKGDHEPDLSYIEAAAHSIASYLRKDNLVILESTSPVGTTEILASIFSKLRPDLSFPSKGGAWKIDVNVAYCPERVLPGFIVTELVNNDRIIGGISPRCSEVARNFYETFIRGQCIETDSRTAEMTKLTENAFRDVNIAFANELSLICEELDINPWNLISLANRHPRVNVLSPGPGVGGHCIAVDPWFIVNATPMLARMIKVAREVNENQPLYILNKVFTVNTQLSEVLNKKINIGIFGLSFKANIDDLRESPALKIAEKIIENRQDFCEINIVEPNIQNLPSNLRHLNVKLAQAREAIFNSDLLLLLVDHKEFSIIDRDLLSGKSIIDTRGIWI
jgi:UDP-N-acetyl-D-mannosaminuronic acid dehydrogenase